MKTKRDIGAEYEEKAADYLDQKGYRIFERNVNYPWGEIDLVAFDVVRNELVFVEVRARKPDGMLEPQETVSTRKLSRLNRAIQTYLASDLYLARNLKPEGARIDLVAFEGEACAHWVNFV